ncbi:MAG: class I SAM-dependent methyltransferase [Solirubrobacterales bacterium]|nr:class I SAM-dependent methyltransferase [Solirubrobacterales bacterium]
MPITARPLLGSDPVGAGIGLASTRQVTAAVHDMYLHHPFPPLQRRHSYRRHAAYMRRFLEEHGVDPAGKTFGDIACGTGLMLLDYAQEFPDTTLIGYDLSEASVDRANQTAHDEGVANAEAHVRDIMSLDVQERFDYILSWGTIHHLGDSREGFSRLCRALKPGGYIRIGVYGYYGNWERRIQQEVVRTVNADLSQLEEQIDVVREWASGDRNFKNYYTAPPVDLGDDDWVVDEFLHVWERWLPLRELVGWCQEEELTLWRLTDYYDNEISLDIGHHSTNLEFVDRVKMLPFEQQCHVIDLIARPYWLSLIMQKPPTAGG